MENKCLRCGNQLKPNAKFCTNCGTKVITGTNSTLNTPENTCECGAELKPGAKFCTTCGKKVQPVVESIVKKENTCECGAELKLGAKFCTKCGRSLEHVVSKTSVGICSCGVKLKLGTKFCTNCGQKVGALPAKTEVSAKKPKRLRKRILISAAAVFVLLLGTAYYFFFYNPGIKKTLLASYEILPNDSTETVISYNDEVTIKIPPGSIKERDSLHLYSVENIDAPEFADAVLRTYDFDFEKTKKFSEEVEVAFSYKNELASNNLSPDQTVQIMYFNEETEAWENTDALIDKRNNSIRVFRSHFSSLGLISHSSASGPMMQVYAMVDPATIDYTPEYSNAQDVVQNYSELKNPDQNAVKDGVDFFLNSFDITALSTDIHEQLFKFERFSKFNKLAGQVTIIRSAISLGIELGQERYIDAIMNVTKTAISVGAAAAGFKFVVIYNVAVFLYDLYSDKLDAEAQETEMNNYMADYNHYNANKNPFRKSIKDWSKFISENIETSVDFEWMLQQEVKKYVESYFETNTDVPEEIKESIMKHESIRMRDVIKEAMILYVKELKEKQERDMIQYLFDMKKEMNSVITIQVCVYGEKEGSKAVRGLPVKIVVDKDQELWSGQTDGAGQLPFQCTWLGYLTYGSPEVVEVTYDGKTYSGKISIDKSNMAVVRIYIDEKNDDSQTVEKPDEFKFSSISGTYAAYCKGFDSYVMDQSGQFVQNTGWSDDEYSTYYLSLTIEKDGSADVTITCQDYCKSVRSGRTQFALNSSNIAEASLNLEYSDNCPPVDNATQKMDDKLKNGSYSAKIQFEDGLMKVQYTEIINFGTDFKAVMYFDAVKQ